MAWPQIAWVVLVGVSLGIGLAQHGKPKTGNHSFIEAIISNGIAVALLYAGGFFS